MEERRAVYAAPRIDPLLIQIGNNVAGMAAAHIKRNHPKAFGSVWRHIKLDSRNAPQRAVCVIGQRTFVLKKLFHADRPDIFRARQHAGADRSRKL